MGAVPLLAWGAMGKNLAYGATSLGPGYSTLAAPLGEGLTTSIMVALLCLFLAFREIRPFTPALFPPLYSVMVCGGTYLGDEHELSTEFGSSNRVGHLESLMDLLGWSHPWHARRDYRMQRIGEAN